jgi:hypothetical protein
VIVGRGDLAAFVLAHRHLRWVAFDAAGVFWHVLGAVPDHPPAVDAWWRAVQENRLHDPLLLDALVRLARDGADPLIPTPDIAARRAAVAHATGRAAADPGTAAAVYRAVRADAIAVPHPGDVTPDARSRFGPLTEAIQVKKAVALAALSRAGIRLDRAALEAAGKDGASLLRHLNAAGGAVVRPTYRVLTATGRTACSAPNVQGVPRDGGVRAAFVPSPGYFLLSVDYTLAELRALAAVCRRRYGRSALADVIQAGGDPHAHTAAALLGVPPAVFAAGLSSGGSPGFDYRRYRQAAKAVNFGVPGGMGVDALVGLARRRFGVRLSAADAAAWRDRLVREVYPELADYLAGGPAGGARVATLTGRVRAGVGPTQALNTPFQGLAADGAALGLFGLVRAGFRVVGFVHDEFLVEIPDRGGYAALADIARAVTAAERGMADVLGGVPAGCRWALARRWGAATAADVVGDRVYPPP